MSDGQNTDERGDDRTAGPILDEQSGYFSLERVKLRSLLIVAVLLGAVSVTLYRVTGNTVIAHIFVSLTLASVCLVVFKLAFYASDFLFTMRAMWMPLIVTATAGILLFYEGQGRDLGVGLLGEGPPKLIVLSLMLIYWAFNNWHSARLGLNYAFPNPSGDARWLFWLPRLLGVCAHFFAAISLSLASWGLIAAAGDSSLVAKVLVATGPIAIALVTFCVWTIDVGLLSKNRRKPIDPRLARALIVGSSLLIIGLFAGVWFGKDRLPDGLFAGTFWISVSAACFLFSVSMWGRTFSSVPVNHDGFSLLLATIATVVGSFIWYSPTKVGNWFGSLNVCFFSFGAALAVLNLFGWISKFFIDRRLAVNRAKFAALFAIFLLLLAAFTSLLRDFHRVQLCATVACEKVPNQAFTSIPTIADRPTVREAALAWYEQAEKLFHKDPDDKRPVPMLVIATAGGGIRAAYWTATVLERLRDDLQKRGRPLDNYLFAVSGVSGGSVGAMDYIATLGTSDNPTTYLEADFLAPAIASLVFVDSPSNVLPDLGQVDRGVALEKAFEAQSRYRLKYSFLSFFPDKADLSKKWRPALFLNATHQETGRRMIASNIKVERDTFLDSFDEFALVCSDMKASTAAHNSARFTYVSPAGKLVPAPGPDCSPKVENRGYIIDGGYFENYGALTALELARSARTEIENEHGHGSIKLVILQISSDPSLTDRTRVRTIDHGQSCLLTTAKAPTPPNGLPNFLPFVDSEYDFAKLQFRKNDGEGVIVSYFNELAAPLIGVTAVRGAHGTLADAELASAVCVEREAVEADVAQSGGGRRVTGIDDTLYAKAASTNAGPTQARASFTRALTSLSERPHFSHLAMCEVAEGGRPPVIPPLGWVLSKPMQKRFPAILDDCKNRAELEGLESALD
jgi:hypothetical protein